MSRHNSSDWSCLSFVKPFSSHSKPSLSQVFSSPRVRSALVRQAHKKAWAGVVAAVLVSVVDGKPWEFTSTCQQKKPTHWATSCQNLMTLSRGSVRCGFGLSHFLTPTISKGNDYFCKVVLLMEEIWYLPVDRFYTGNYRMIISHMMQDFSHELWETLLDFQMSIEESHPSIKRGQVHVCKKAPASVESDVWGGWQYQESRLLFKTKMVGCHFGSQN